MDYEVRRDRFNQIVKNYTEYLQLYSFLNNGSKEGATPFDEFYWRFTYYVKYDEPERILTIGY